MIRRRLLSKKNIVFTGCILFVILVLCVVMSILKKNNDNLPVDKASDTIAVDGSEGELLDEKNNDTDDNGKEDLTNDKNRDIVSADGSKDELTDGKNSNIVSSDDSKDNLLDETPNDTISDDQGTDDLKGDNNNTGLKDAKDDNKLTDEKKKDELLAEEDISDIDMQKLLSSTTWHEISSYTYLAARFSTDGTFDIWDTVGNPCMKGNFILNTENKTITLNCSEDVDFNPPFQIPKEATCSIYLTKEGYLCIQYQEDKLLFKMDNNVKDEAQMMGYIWNASSASDGTDVSGLKLSLGRYFALYNKNTTYFVSELYSIGTKTGYITINWSYYSNADGEYKFTYSILPYIELGFWDLSDKAISIDEASDTFEEDMKLQLSYQIKKDTLELEYDGVTITFTRGKSSKAEDEAIFQKLMEN